MCKQQRALPQCIASNKVEVQVLRLIRNWFLHQTKFSALLYTTLLTLEIGLEVRLHSWKYLRNVAFEYSDQGSGHIQPISFIDHVGYTFIRTQILFSKASLHNALAADLGNLEIKAQLRQASSTNFPQSFTHIVNTAACECVEVIHHRDSFRRCFRCVHIDPIMLYSVVVTQPLRTEIIKSACNKPSFFQWPGQLTIL